MQPWNTYVSVVITVSGYSLLPVDHHSIRPRPCQQSALDNCVLWVISQAVTVTVTATSYRVSDIILYRLSFEVQSVTDSDSVIVL